MPLELNCLVVKPKRFSLIAKTSFLILSLEVWRCPHHPYREGHRELIGRNTWCQRSPSIWVLVARPSPDILGVEFAATFLLTFPNTHSPPTTTLPISLEWFSNEKSPCESSDWLFRLKILFSFGLAIEKNTTVWRDGKKTKFRIRGLYSFGHTILTKCRLQSCHALAVQPHRKAWFWTLVLTFIKE